MVKFHRISAEICAALKLHSQQSKNIYFPFPPRTLKLLLELKFMFVIISGFLDSSLFTVCVFSLSSHLRRRFSATTKINSIRTERGRRQGREIEQSLQNKQMQKQAQGKNLLKYLSENIQKMLSFSR